jgi:hypothetical protein
MTHKLEISAFGTATIGSIIEALQFAEPDADVMFDFCYMAPTTLKSYRGYYEHLALGWEKPEQFPFWPKVSEFLVLLEAAIGATFSAYKGGGYRMSRSTPLWVDNYSDASGTGIVGVEFLGELTVILNTAKVD